MEEVTVRNANPEDSRGIATVHVKMWQSAYKGQVPDSYLDSLSIDSKAEGWKKELENPHPGSFAYVAESDGKVQGWITGGVSRDKDLGEDVGELYGIYVHPDTAGKGVGSKLMSKLLETLKTQGYKQITLWVLDTNKKTRDWYEAKGWRVEGKTKTESHGGGFDLNEVRYITDL